MIGVDKIYILTIPNQEECMPVPMFHYRSVVGASVVLAEPPWLECYNTLCIRQNSIQMVFLHQPLFKLVYAFDVDAAITDDAALFNP